MSKIKLQTIVNGILVKAESETIYFEYTELATRFVEFYLKSNDGRTHYSLEQSFDIFEANPTEEVIKLKKELDKKYQSAW
jgi:hypothetical protein